MKNKKLYPECLNTDRQICLNAAGYFTPCCWFDADDAIIEDPQIIGFFDKELNISNHEDPKDIIEGEYWTNFFKLLQHDPNNAPKRCWRNCGSTQITDKTLSDGTRIKI